MRGVILAGGTGSRLGLLTKAVNKHMLPVGNAPMIVHALRKLQGYGIVDILIITSPEAIEQFAALIGSGNRFACEVSYRVQDKPGGIGEALLSADTFCTESFIVLLADNIFEESLKDLVPATGVDNNLVFLKQVPEANAYGVAEFRQLEADNKVATPYLFRIVEKPYYTTSNMAVTGIYVYQPSVFEIIKEEARRPRLFGEFGITVINNKLLEAGRLGHCVLGGYWIDAGTLESLRTATQLVTDNPPRYH